MLQTAERPSDTTITIMQGTQASLDGHKLGIMSVSPESALLSVTVTHADLTYRVQVSTKPGELLPVGGKLYRVARISYAAAKKAGEAPLASGQSKSHIVLDKEPVSVPGLDLGNESLVLPLGATASFLGYDLELLAVTGEGKATLEIWPGDFAKPQTKAELITKHEVKAQQTVKFGAHTLRIKQVLASKPEAGVSGLIEMER